MRVCMRMNLTTCVLHHQTMCHFPFYILISHFFSFVRANPIFLPPIDSTPSISYISSRQVQNETLFVRAHNSLLFIPVSFYLNSHSYTRCAKILYLCRFLTTFFHPLFLASFLWNVISFPFLFASHIPLFRLIIFVFVVVEDRLFCSVFFGCTIQFSLFHFDSFILSIHLLCLFFISLCIYASAILLFPVCAEHQKQELSANYILHLTISILLKYLKHFRCSSFFSLSFYSNVSVVYLPTFFLSCFIQFDECYVNSLLFSWRTHEKKSVIQLKWISLLNSSTKWNASSWNCLSPRLLRSKTYKIFQRRNPHSVQLNWIHVVTSLLSIEIKLSWYFLSGVKQLDEK